MDRIDDILEAIERLKAMRELRLEDEEEEEEEGVAVPPGRPFPTENIVKSPLQNFLTS